MPGKEALDVRPAFIISQHRDPAERFVILTEKVTICLFIVIVVVVSGAFRQ